MTPPVVWVAPSEAPEGRRAAEALGVDPELLSAAALPARLARGQPDVLVVAGEGALDLCRSARALRPLPALPVLALGAPLGEAFAAGASDGLDAGWRADELALRVSALARAHRLHEEAIAEARHEGRQIEAELEALFASAPVGLAVIDRRLRYVRVNQALASFKGSTVEAHLGRTVGELLPDHTGRIEQVYRRVLETGEPSLDHEVVMQASLRHYLAHYFPVRVESEVVGVAVLVIDNTDRWRATQRAEEANRQKDEFLANLSHELRTPLTAILGWAHILRTRALPDDKRARALESVERNAVALTRLVEDLLDVSRIIADRLTLERAPVDLALVIETAVEAVRPLAEQQQLRLDAAPFAAAAPVTGDAERLRQVVSNLLSNAVKFTPAGGSVTVLLEREGPWARITVTDTGQGISADFLPFVFERFRQADSGATRAHGGLGLGLAIAHHLVRLHHGTLQAASPGEGQGATFTVRLPLGEPPING